MSDIVLFKIDNLFSKKITKVSGQGFYADLLPGEATAIGFDLSSVQESFDTMPWSFAVKIINSSKYNLFLKKISVFWIGKKMYAKSSKLVSFKEINSNKQTEEEFLPILLNAGTEKKIRISIFMDFYYKKFLFFKKKKIFYKSKIKEPDTYKEMVKNILIQLETENSKVKIKI